MLSQVVGYSFWALTGVTKQNTEESSGTAGTKADLRSISCWASSLMRTSRLSICAPRGECVCPFCSQIRPVVAQLLLPWYDACAVEHSFVILRVGSIGDCFFFTNRSHEKGLLVVKVQRAQQFGDGSPCWIFLWATPKRRFVVIANQASRNVSELVLPAPKTPAMAKEDRPDCRAETMDRAIERMWALSVPAAEHSCRLKPVAWGQYRGVSAVTNRPKSACRLCNSSSAPSN